MRTRTLAVSVLAVAGLCPASTAAAATPTATPAAACTAGAQTLARPGSVLYPEAGNGGYTSVHTLVHLVYDADHNAFLPGNRVALTERAAQCLSRFSLDLETHSANKTYGPDLSVRSVTVDGRPASFSLRQPTYPGDPHGPDDPEPAAHQASLTNPVGGPHHNPLPPACTPAVLDEDKADARNGTACPASKLVVTPRRPLPAGATFTVTVDYTGHPGVHTDGDAEREGWQRTRDGGFVTTEPVGTEDWMPVNNYPTAKPSYDVVDTVTAGRSVLANGVLRKIVHNGRSALFPHGSTTWMWHSPAPVGNYLVASSVGHYPLQQRVAADGKPFYTAQDTAITGRRRAANQKILDQLQQVTAYEATFNGPYPFSSDGVVIGTPTIQDGNELQTMTAIGDGTIDPTLLYHENMHQWWGDNVGEGSFEMTFFKEGLAVVAEYLYAARKSEAAAGGPGTSAGRAAFQRSLVARFNRSYGQGGSFWTVAPSRPTPTTLFDDDPVYTRPAAAYLALRQILGPDNFVRVLRRIQHEYGGRTITEPQEESVFAAYLPVRTTACRARLGAFFHQWFDTAYRRGGGRPKITGPGLHGPNFYDATGGCPRRR